MKPGDGRKVDITGQNYDSIWAAALKVADEHFEIREQDKAKGIIMAERTTTMFGWGAWIGIYVVPKVQAGNNTTARQSDASRVSLSDVYVDATYATPQFVKRAGALGRPVTGSSARATSFCARWTRRTASWARRLRGGS